MQKAYRYQRNIIDDGIHRYGRTVTEIAVELPEATPEAKHFRWVITNVSDTFFADKAFAGLVEPSIQFYKGMTMTQIRALTPEEREAHKTTARDQAAKQDDRAREESRAQAQQIEIPTATYDRMVQVARYKQVLEQAKKELQVDLKDLLGGPSKGYVG